MSSQAERIAEGFAGKRVLVMGLGRFGGGVGVTRYLAEHGAHVTVTDLSDEHQLAQSLSQLTDLDIEYHLGGHREDDFSHTDWVVVNPAVKKSSPYLALAREHGVALTSEMAIFFVMCPARIVGITGSNGKSTTTAMIARVLEAGAGQGRYQGRAMSDQAGDPPENPQTSGGGIAGRADVRGYRRVWLGGNIGRESLLVRVDEIAPDDLVVLELSSFQLYDLAELQRSPHLAVVTNIAPNHLDWHGTMDDYIQAKQHIVRYQQPGDMALLCGEDPSLAPWEPLCGGMVAWYPSDRDDPATIELSVPGRHNRINASAALVVGRFFGVPELAMQRALREYHGLPHRLEFVAEVNGVRYYNDSIATTPESTVVAIEAFSEPKVMILGGYDKKLPFDELCRRMVADGSVTDVILIGQVRQTIATVLTEAKQATTASAEPDPPMPPAPADPQKPSTAARQVPAPADSPSHPGTDRLPRCHFAETLEQAVTLSARLSCPGGVVLLSPACASYDMFRNFEQRGQQFRQAVHALAPSS